MYPQNYIKITQKSPFSGLEYRSRSIGETGTFLKKSPHVSVRGPH